MCHIVSEVVHSSDPLDEVEGKGVNPLPSTYFYIYYKNIKNKIAIEELYRYMS